MEWGRVKSIFIVLFLLVNLVLMLFYLDTIGVEEKIDDEAVENVVEILKNSNIMIDESIIPREPYVAHTFTASNNYSSAAKVVADARAKSSASGKKYFDVSCVKLSKDSFEYVAVRDEDKMNIKKLEDAEEYAKEILNVSGLIKGIQVEYDSFNSDGIYKVVFYRVVDDIRIFDSYIRVEMDSNSVKNVYAYNWLKDDISGLSVVSEKAITEVLINFAFAESGNITAPITITKLEYGYYLGSRGGETKTVTASPVWKIYTDNNRVYYCDVRNGDILS